MKLSAQIALIVSVLALAVPAYANSETQTNTETMAQTEEVVEMVGVRHAFDDKGGGGWFSMGVGTISGVGSYVYSAICKITTP